jgi:hypothetical protein
MWIRNQMTRPITTHQARFAPDDESAAARAGVGLGDAGVGDGSAVGDGATTSTGHFKVGGMSTGGLEAGFCGPVGYWHAWPRSPQT